MAVALVTGAGRGIGQAIALRLASDGLAVAVNDIDAAAAERTAADARAGGGRAVAAPADVSDAAQVTELVRRLASAVGPPTILVNNAAAMTMAPLAELDRAAWRLVVRTNLHGAFHCARAVVGAMKEVGFGRIVNIASDWGLRGAAGASHYAASKAGLVSFTKALARELGPAGITVNAVAPGAIDTPQLSVDAAYAGVSPAEIRARYAQETPLGRIGRPDEVAATVSYLVSDRAACVTGQVFCPNGGSSR